MNESCKIKKLKENIQSRKKLNELGIYGIIDSRGPRGEIGPMGSKGMERIAGPRGEQGIPGGITAYAERYFNTKETQSIQSNTETTVKLDKTGLMFNTLYLTENAINIHDLGVYKIDYFLTCEPSVDSILTIAIKKNQEIIEGSNIRGDGIAAYFTELSGTVITQLLPDDVITLIVKTDKAVDLSFNGSINAKLSLIKLN